MKPAPSVVAPIPTRFVSAGVDEPLELAVGHRPLADAERAEGEAMLWDLALEKLLQAVAVALDEVRDLLTRRPHQELAGRHLDPRVVGDARITKKPQDVSSVGTRQHRRTPRGV